MFGISGDDPIAPSNTNLINAASVLTDSLRMAKRQTHVVLS